MARVETYQITLGGEAPDFNLPDVSSGESVSLSQVRGEKATVVMFICNHCPFVVHVIDELVQLGKDYKDAGVGFVAISSNDVVNYPADHPDMMKALAQEKHFPFPYLYDESQEIAKAYTAMCTPDFSVFDQDLKCIYRGQLDNSRPGNDEPINGEDLRCVLDAALIGSTCIAEQKPSIGCNIKWLNNEFPAYAQ